MKKTLLLLLPLALMLGSCRSSKKATADDSEKTQPTTTIHTQPAKDTDKKKDTAQAAGIAAGTNFTSKVKVTIVQDGKDITTTGTLRMRYDDVIQLTLVDPLLGIAELGRLELSPEKMLIIDRINKRYVETPYSDFAAFKANKLDFATIQDFFWKEAQTSDRLSYTIPAKKSIQLDLELSGKGNAANWNAHTTVSDKYTKTDANQLFGQLVGQ